MKYHPRRGSAGYRIYAQLQQGRRMTAAECAEAGGIKTKQVMCSLRYAIDSGVVRIEADMIGRPVYVAQAPREAPADIAGLVDAAAVSVSRPTCPCSVWDYARRVA